MEYGPLFVIVLEIILAVRKFQQFSHRLNLEKPVNSEENYYG